MLDYDFIMLEDELDRVTSAINMYRSELNRLESEYHVPVNKKLLNIIHPQTIKVDEQVAGLTVKNVTANDYGSEYGYSYDIQFEGEFTIGVELDYDEMFEQFFGITTDLGKIPYVVREDTTSTAFLINDPKNLLANAKDGDKITAKFNDYAIRRMSGKPLSDITTIILVE